MYKYRVIGLDVFRGRDGFDVNGFYYTGKTLTFQPGFTDKDIIRTLKALGFIRRGFQFKSFTIEGEDDFTLFVDHKRHGPVVHLERVKT